MNGQGKVIFVGNLSHGSTSRYRVRALRQMGYQVLRIDSNAPRKLAAVEKAGLKLKRPIDLRRNNMTLRRMAKWANIIFLDTTVHISPKTLHFVRETNPRLFIITHHSDHFGLAHYWQENFNQVALLSDGFITTRAASIPHLNSLGQSRVSIVTKSFDPIVHRPYRRTPSTQKIDVGFIGTFEMPRAQYMMDLEKLGISIQIRGDGWKKSRKQGLHSLYTLPSVRGHEYAFELSRTNISLGFVRQMNYDQHTSRSMEIPACGSLLVAERTQEHQQLFDDCEEAFFFDSLTELADIIEKCKRDPEAASLVAHRGRQRCISSGYSYRGQLHQAFVQLGVPNY